MEHIKQCGRVKQVAMEGNPTTVPASLCVCAWLISRVWEIHQVLNNILQMQGNDTHWSPDLNQRDGESRCFLAHLRRANKPGRQLLISTVSGDPRRWRAAVLMEPRKLRQGDSINWQPGSSQQFMVSRLTGHGGAQGSKITIHRRSMITGRELIAYASGHHPPHTPTKGCFSGLRIKFMNVTCSSQQLASFVPFAHWTYPEIDILFLLSIFNVDLKSCARQIEAIVQSRKQAGTQFSVGVQTFYKARSDNNSFTIWSSWL